MINEPNALWVRMLKGLYYHDKTIMEVGKGARASWIWSSLIEGRNFIKEKMLWQVVGGKDVSIWRDIWVPGLGGQKLRAPGLVDCEVPERVEEIIDREKGEWNLEAIENWLTGEEKQAIEVIPVSEQEGEDRLIWSYNSSRVYTVNSGY